MDKDKISFKDISELRVARIGLEEVEEVKNTVGFVNSLHLGVLRISVHACLQIICMLF